MSFIEYNDGGLLLRKGKRVRRWLQEGGQYNLELSRVSAPPSSETVNKSDNAPDSQKSGQEDTAASVNATAVASAASSNEDRGTEPADVVNEFLHGDAVAGTADASAAAAAASTEQEKIERNEEDHVDDDLDVDEHDDESPSEDDERSTQEEISAQPAESGTQMTGTGTFVFCLKRITTANAIVLRCSNAPCKVEVLLEASGGPVVRFGRQGSVHNHEPPPDIRQLGCVSLLPVMLNERSCYSDNEGYIYVVRDRVKAQHACDPPQEQQQQKQLQQSEQQLSQQERPKPESPSDQSHHGGQDEKEEPMEEDHQPEQQQSERQEEGQQQQQQQQQQPQQQQQEQQQQEKQQQQEQEQQKPEQQHEEHQEEKDKQQPQQEKQEQQQQRDVPSENSETNLHMKCLKNDCRVKLIVVGGPLRIAWMNQRHKHPPPSTDHLATMMTATCTDSPKAVDSSQQRELSTEEQTKQGVEPQHADSTVVGSVASSETTGSGVSAAAAASTAAATAAGDTDEVLDIEGDIVFEEEEGVLSEVGRHNYQRGSSRRHFIGGSAPASGSGTQENVEEFEWDEVEQRVTVAARQPSTDGSTSTRNVRADQSSIVDGNNSRIMVSPAGNAMAKMNMGSTGATSNTGGHRGGMTAASGHGGITMTITTSEDGVVQRVLGPEIEAALDAVPTAGGAARPCRCPLCANDLPSHDLFLKHMMLDHGIPLVCTEHEFRTVAEFDDWRQRVQHEEYLLLAHQWGKRRTGIWICSQLRDGPGRQVAVPGEPRKGACPSSLIVTRTPTGKLCVRFWRTHVGHKPNIFDLRVSIVQQRWVAAQLAMGCRPNRICAEAAKSFHGGVLSRDFVLRHADIVSAAQEQQAAIPYRGAWRTGSEAPKADMSFVDKLRCDLVSTIEVGFLDGLTQSNRVQRKHPVNPMSVIPGPDGCFVAISDSGPHSGKGALVYARKSNHACCELLPCDTCGVCLHRYGCTCAAFTASQRMCKHIHSVVAQHGAPPDTVFVDEHLARESLGTQKAIDTLAGLNLLQMIRELEILELLEEIRTLIQLGIYRMNFESLRTALVQALKDLKTSRVPEEQEGLYVEGQKILSSFLKKFPNWEFTKNGFLRRNTGDGNAEESADPNMSQQDDGERQNKRIKLEHDTMDEDTQDSDVVEVVDSSVPTVSESSAKPVNVDTDMPVQRIDDSMIASWTNDKPASTVGGNSASGTGNEHPLTCGGPGGFSTAATSAHNALPGQPRSVMTAHSTDSCSNQGVKNEPFQSSYDVLNEVGPREIIQDCSDKLADGSSAKTLMDSGRARQCQRTDSTSFQERAPDPSKFASLRGGTAQTASSNDNWPFMVAPSSANACSSASKETSPAVATPGLEPTCGVASSQPALSQPVQMMQNPTASMGSVNPLQSTNSGYMTDRGSAEGPRPMASGIVSQTTGSFSRGLEVDQYRPSAMSTVANSDSSARYCPPIPRGMPSHTAVAATASMSALTSLGPTMTTEGAHTSLMKKTPSGQGPGLQVVVVRPPLLQQTELNKAVCSQAPVLQGMVPRPQIAAPTMNVCLSSSSALASVTQKMAGSISQASTSSAVPQKNIGFGLPTLAKPNDVSMAYDRTDDRSKSYARRTRPGQDQHHDQLMASTGYASPECSSRIVTNQANIHGRPQIPNSTAQQMVASGFSPSPSLAGGSSSLAMAQTASAWATSPTMGVGNTRDSTNVSNAVFVQVPIVVSGAQGNRLTDDRKIVVEVPTGAATPPAQSARKSKHMPNRLPTTRP